MRLNMGILKRTGAILTGLSLVFFFQNCADQKFTDAPGAVIKTDTGGPNCSEQLESITTPVEMVFVVDMSGSNFENNGGPGTDPNKTIRAGSITSFFNHYKTKNNFSWSLVTFKGSAASTLASSDNAASMDTAIVQLMSMSDSGGTPYGAALDNAHQAVQNSPNAQYKKYVVVFWSDGLPNPAISDINLKAKVSNIMNVHPGQVSVNTVYYGPIDSTASGRLKMMSVEGQGNFLDTNLNGTGTVFSINDLVVVPGVVCN